MSLQAGRVGVAATEVDSRGKVKRGGLSPEQQAKIDRALVIPINAPHQRQLTGVNTGNSQIMATIGNGLILKGTTSPFELGLDVAEYSSEDAGKVLTIGEDGTLQWQDKGQGGGYEFFNFLEEEPYLTNITFQVSGSDVKLISGYNPLYKVDISNIGHGIIVFDTDSPSLFDLWACYSDDGDVEIGDLLHTALKQNSSEQTRAYRIDSTAGSYLYIRGQSNYLQRAYIFKETT